MRKDRLLRHLLKERFTITLRGGASFDGLLIDADEKTVRFVDVFALDTNSRVRVDGDLFIPRGEVLYMQRPVISA